MYLAFAFSCVSLRLPGFLIDGIVHQRVERPLSESTSRRVRLWACYGALMCVAIVVNLPPVYFTTFRDTFGGSSGLTDEQLGRISAFIFASLVLGIVITGPLADRLGARLFALLGLALASVGLALMGLAADYASLLLAAGVMGFGAGVIDMVLNPIVTALVPERRASALNWLHSFYCTGAVLTVVVGSCALRLELPWRTVFKGMAAFPVILLACFALMRFPPLVSRERGRTPVGVLLCSGVFLAGLLAMFLGGASEAAMGQWLPTFAERSLGYAKSTAGLALAGFLVAMAVGRISAATIARHVHPLRLMTASCVLAVVFYLVGCFVPTPAVAVAGCMMVGLTVSCLWPTMMGVTSDRFPHGGASMFALLAAAGNAGCFVMPWIVGLVAEHTTLSIGLATAGICPVLLVGVLWWISRRMNQPSGETGDLT